MKLKSVFGDKPFLKRLMSIAMPLTLQNLMLAAVAAADAFMLGTIEQNAMSAVSEASQIQFIQNIILGAVVAAQSALGAQYWGKKDMDSLNDVFCTALRVGALISFICFAGCVFIPEALMRIFTNVDELVEIGARYLKIAGWSYLLTGISQCYLMQMKISEHSKQVATISTCTVLINIFLNAVFIYGLFGIEAMHERGAAVATLISRIIELVWVMAISYKKGYIHPELKRIIKRNALLAKDYARCVIPLAAAALVWGVGFTAYTAFMGHKGEDAAAANSIAAVVRDMVCCMCNGLSQAGGIIVGNELGKGDLKKGKLYGDRVMIMSYILGFASTLIMLALIPLLLRVIKLSDGARGLLPGLMIVMSVYMIGRVVNTVIINGIFAAGGDTMFDLYSLAVTMWLLAVPLAFLGTFVFNWHPVIVYACTCLDEVGKIPWVMIHYRKNKWVKDLTREKAV